MGTVGAAATPSGDPFSGPTAQARAEAARRLVPHAGNQAVNRLAELAASLLDAPSAQVSLLSDVQHVAGGAGLGDSAVASSGPVEESLCTVTVGTGAPLRVDHAGRDTRVRHLPPVTTGKVGAYLGVPLVTEAGHPIGALCVFGPEPRVWSSRDLELLGRLAGPIVAELELAALTNEYDSNRLMWELAVDAAGVGAFDWHLATQRLSWDHRLLDLFGYDLHSFGSHIDDFNRRLHPDDLPRVSAALGRAIETCGDYSAEYRIVLPDGTVRWIAARGRAICGDSGRAERVVGAAYDTTEIHRLEARVARVLEAMATAVFSLDREWRFTYVNAEAERVLGATRQRLLGQVIWDSVLETVGEQAEQHYRAAVETGDPTTFETHLPPPLDAWYEVRAWPTPDGLSVYFLDVTERRHAAEVLERTARRAEVIARVSGELTSSLDTDESVGRLARALVPDYADWCAVTLLDEHPHADLSRRLRGVSSWHRDPSMQPVLDRYLELAVTDMRDSERVRHALSDTAATTVVADTSELVDEFLHPGEARDLLERLGPGPALSLPLRGRGKLLGLLSLTRRQGGAAYDEHDISTLEEIAARAGLALDNALLFSQQRDLAEGLQRSLLTEPPVVAGVDVIVRYQPAAEAAQVGGDWYDSFRLVDDDIAVVIGDVVGHDTAAAAAMGQVRSLMRGIAVHGNEGPAEVLRGVDRAMETLEISSTATAVLARLQPFTRADGARAYRLTWSNAGHPPPFVIVPGEPAAELDAGHGDLLLGIDSRLPRHELSLELSSGATVLLYTDGLVERRDQPLDVGVRRLRGTLDDLVREGLGLEAMCDELLARLVPVQGEDDVALVAVRLG